MARLVLKFGGTERRQCRAHPQCRAPCQTRGRRRSRGRRRRLRHVRQDQRARRLGGARGPRRCTTAAEYDAVVASGELVTAGLLAIVLKSMGIDARSWQGWQIPMAIPTTRTAPPASRGSTGGEDHRGLRARGQVAVVAGFQGVHAQTNRVATLGRGGSDTSAVALAAALKGGPLRHLYRRRRRLYHRPARRAESAAARQGVVRGNARNGLAGRQGAAGALGRSRDGA